MKTHYKIRPTYSSLLEPLDSRTYKAYTTGLTSGSDTIATMNGRKSTSVTGSVSRERGLCVKCGARGDAYFSDILYCAPCAIDLQKKGRL